MFETESLSQNGKEKQKKTEEKRKKNIQKEPGGKAERKKSF